MGYIPRAVMIRISLHEFSGLGSHQMKGKILAGLSANPFGITMGPGYRV